MSSGLLLENGVIRTLDARNPIVRELGIAGDLIADGRSGASIQRVDLRGRCVLPGFVDAHVHFPTWSVRRVSVQLDGCGTVAEAVCRVRSAVTEARPDRWLVGWGWADAELSPEVPMRHALDEAVGSLPVALWSRDMHSLWLSSAGLARARGDLDAVGGVVERDAVGEPTGLLREAAAWHFRERYIDVGIDEYVLATIAGIELAHARGVTAIHDKDGWLGAPEIWRRVRDRGALSLRVWQSVPHDRASEYERSKPGDEAFLRIGYLKVFMDGSLGSRTALMLDDSGVATTSGEELAEIIRTAAAAGWPLAVHAIGDKANREALDAFEATKGEWQPRGLRQRIEHAQHVHPDDLARFAELGLACSVGFADAILSRDEIDRLEPGVADRSFVFRSMWDSGALVVNGSDAPLTDLDPLLGLRAAALRTLDDRPAWRPAQSLTVEEALQASIVNPAFLSGDEHRLGRLAPGYLADLVVLDHDPVTCSSDELAETRVLATMVGGRWVYNPPPWD